MHIMSMHMEFAIAKRVMQFPLSKLLQYSIVA